MTDDVDAILEAELRGAKSPEEPTSKTQPVVVIEYHTRGLPWRVVIPLLVLVPLGAVALYHNLMQSRARWRPAPGSSAAPGRDRGKPVERASVGVPVNPFETGPSLLSSPFGGFAAPLPLSLNTQPLPKALPPPSPPGREGPTPAVATAPAATQPRAATPPPPPPVPIVKEGTGGRSGGTAGPELASGAFEKGPLAVGFSAPVDRRTGLPAGTSTNVSSDAHRDDGAVPATKADRPDRVPPSEQPIPTKDELIDAIRAEAAEKRAEQQNLLGMKERARDEVASDAVDRVNAERVEFRQQLEEILTSESRTKGQDIDELCDRFGRAYDPMIRKRAGYVLSHVSGRMSLQAKVKVLRRLGVPEPAVLDFLANELHRYVNSRNGPRDANDVRVSAANQLLSMRLTGTAGASRPADHARQPRRAN